MAEILETSSGVGNPSLEPSGIMKRFQDDQNNGLHANPGNHFQRLPFSPDLSKVVADDDVGGEAMSHLLQHSERFFIIFNPFIQVVDFPDGLVVSDHIDKDLIDTRFFQSLSGSLLDEPGMADDPEFRGLCLDGFYCRDESRQRDLSIFIGSTAYQNTEGAFRTEAIDDLLRASQDLSAGIIDSRSFPLQWPQRRSQWVPVTLIAANLSS